MGIILLVLLLALILGGLGFAVHVLWWIALVVLVIWLIGFVVRVGEGTSRRWYRWLQPCPVPAAEPGTAGSSSGSTSGIDAGPAVWKGSGDCGRAAGRPMGDPPVVVS